MSHIDCLTQEECTLQEADITLGLGWGEIGGTKNEAGCRFKNVNIEIQA